MTRDDEIAALKERVDILESELATLQRSLATPTTVHIDYREIVRAIRDTDAKAGYLDFDVGRKLS
jgi:hypothetical protein